MLLVKQKILELEQSFVGTSYVVGVLSEMLKIGCNEVSFTILHHTTEEILTGKEIISVI